MKERIIKFIICVALMPVVWIIAVGLIPLSFVFPIVALIDPKAIKLGSKS